MGKLLDFLIEHPVDNLTEEIVISDRLSKWKFKIRAMTGVEFSEYQNLSTNISSKRKVKFDSAKFNQLVVLNHTVEPNFRDVESIKKAGCQTPEQFLYKALVAGEIAELSQRISKLSGFDQEINEVIEEAKN